MIDYAEMLPENWFYAEYQGWKGHWCISAIPAPREFTDDLPHPSKMSLSRDHAWLCVLKQAKRKNWSRRSLMREARKLRSA